MKCCIEGCDKPTRAKQLCQVHYARMRSGRSLTAPQREVIRTGSDEDRLKSKTKVSASTGCWEWQASLTEHGYGQMRFRGTRELAHRVAWILFKGVIPKNDSTYGTVNVLHRCDNPRCVNPEHLFLGDQFANCTDSISKGRWGTRGCKGEAHGRAVMTEEIVREIRASSLTRTELAQKFGVSLGAISHIQKRRTWRHLT